MDLSSLGLGDLPTLSLPDISPLASVSIDTSSPASSSPSFFDQLQSGFNTVSSLVSQGSKVVSQVQNVLNSGSGSSSAQVQQKLPAIISPFAQTQTQVQSQPVTQATGLSTGAKVAIGFGIAAALGTLIYFVAKSK